ncbi:MAG: ATPase [Alphaproteobacteria bacterium]|nr:ATPase [Alphaproteobacteria bacterium]
MSRLFWRPVAAAIARRQTEATELLDKAKTTDAKAEAARAELEAARADIARERVEVLAVAAKAAQAAAAEMMAAARKNADKLIEAAKLANDREAASAQKQRNAQAADLSVDIASKLLGRLDAPAVHAAFLDLLVAAIAEMPAKDRAAVLATDKGIDIVSTTDLAPDEKTSVVKAIGKALGQTPDFNFVTDLGLIAGLELRTAHFEVHNSWQSDLKSIRKELGDAC